MRVYVPATVRGLITLRDEGFEAPVTAHAVTGALREWYIEGDRDELEYAASSQAAHASLRLLAAAAAPAADPGAPSRQSRQGRRVVVAADVSDSAVRPVPGTRSAVVVDRTITIAQVISLHVDGDEARADVAAAVAAVAAADAGDQDAQFTVDGADGHELLWYDVTELDDVLGLD